MDSLLFNETFSEAVSFACLVFSALSCVTEASNPNQIPVSTVSSVSPLSHGNFDFKNLLRQIKLARVLERVAVTLSLLLPSAVAIFQAAAADTPQMRYSVSFGRHSSGSLKH